MRFWPRSAQFTGSAGILIICVAALLIPGCGRKLFPKPFREGAVPQVRDLRAQITTHGVELSWPIPEGAAQGNYRYSVMKTELKWENRNCPDCPGITQPVMHGIDPAAAKAMSTPDHRMQWLDPKAAPRRAFRYQVSVLDENEQPVTQSNPVIAKVFPGPPAPTNFSAATQPQGIFLQWKPVTKDAQGSNLQGELLFKIERKLSDKVWEEASAAPVKGSSYLDGGVAPEQSYSYRIIPVLMVENTGVYGAPSPITMAKAPEAVLPPPPKSVWVVPAKGALEVRWTESDGKNGGYHVYRREGKQIVRLTATPVQHPPFVDGNVKRNETYSYAVSTVSVQAGKEGLLSKWAEMRALLLE